MSRGRGKIYTKRRKNKKALSSAKRKNYFSVSYKKFFKKLWKKEKINLDKIGQIGEDVVRPIGEVRRSSLVVAGHSAGRKLIPQKDHDAVVADLVVPGRIPGIQLPHG